MKEIKRSIDVNSDDMNVKIKFEDLEELNAEDGSDPVHNSLLLSGFWEGKDRMEKIVGMENIENFKEEANNNPAEILNIILREAVEGGSVEK